MLDTKNGTTWKDNLPDCNNIMCTVPNAKLMKPYPNSTHLSNLKPIGLQIVLIIGFSRLC